MLQASGEEALLRLGEKRHLSLLGAQPQYQVARTSVLFGKVPNRHSKTHCPGQAQLSKKAPIERMGARLGGTSRGISNYTRDPDGNLLEFIVYPSTPN